MSFKEDQNDAIICEAKRAIERAEAQSDVIGGSSISRMTTKIGNRFRARDVDQSDAIELLGTRIGRILGFFAFFCLLIYFLFTYFLN